MKRNLIIAMVVAVPGLLIATGSVLERSVMQHVPLEVRAATDALPADSGLGAVITLDTAAFSRTHIEGLLLHEHLHVWVSAGRLGRDVPVAAANEYCLTADSLSSGPIRRTMRRATLAASALQAPSRSQGRRAVLAAMDTILSRNNRQIEGPATYLAAAELAALALAMTDSRVQCSQFMWLLATGATAELAYKALHDERYRAWIGAAYSTLSDSLLEETYALRNVLTPDDWLGMDWVLSTVVARDSVLGRRHTTKLASFARRVARSRVQNVVALGSSVEFVSALGDADYYRGQTVRWQLPPPRVRVNLRGVDGDTIRISSDLTRYIGAELSRWSSVLGGWGPTQPVRYEMGVYQRNAPSVGVIDLQWSPLIEHEAETTLVLWNSEIVAALVSVHPRAAYADIVGQGLARAFGFVGQFELGVRSIMQQPLPRPESLLRSRYYEDALNRFFQRR